MKIILFGKNGQVGWELQRSLSPLGELIALDRHSPNHIGDLTYPLAVTDFIKSQKPDVVVNAAAYTAVDAAETDYNLAFTVNALGAEAISWGAYHTNAWFVHFSTDYVFHGGGTTPWQEDDEPWPINQYGQGKLSGERLASIGHRHLTFRTSWVYSARGGNFVKTMLRLAQEREQLKVINDQFGAPTGAELIADVAAHAIRQVTQMGDAGEALSGFYHLAASGETTWFEYAKHVLAQAQQAQPAIHIKATEVLPVSSDEFPSAARRPLNSRLDTRKLQSTFGLTLPPWQNGVNRMLDEYLQCAVPARA